MATRTLAAVAEQLSRLADDMASVADVLRANRSRVPAHPHLSGLVMQARRVATALRKHAPDNDGSISLAREIISWCEVWRGWGEVSARNQADAILAHGMDAAVRFVAAHAQELRS